MNDECLEPHKKEFLTECQQIEFWNKCLSQIHSQIYTLDQILNLEEQACNSKANHLTQLSNEYYVNCQKISGEPSNIFYLTQIILDMYLKNITISRSQIARLNSDLGNTIKDILLGITFVKEKIMQVSQKTMKEVTELRHSSALFQGKYSKLKLNLDEAQMNKKRLESNPKFTYNITMKTQSEQRVLEKVQQMEKILPTMQSLSKDLIVKKEEFNLIMKDNFEIVILNTFKHLAHLHQCLFLMAKNRLDISNEIKNVIHDSLNLLTKFSVNINDFTEKKFAALQGIKFDSIEMLNINEEFIKSNVGQLINASNSVINYVNTFYACLKMRKTLMKRSLKYFTQYKTYEREAKESFHRKEKKFNDILQTMTSLGTGTSTSWKILFNSFHINDTAREKTMIINEIVEYITQSKCDYTEMKQKWTKIEEKIIERRNEIESIDISIRKKLQENSSISNNKKLIEEQINKKIIEKSPKVIEILNQANDFIKINLSSLREKDIKRCNKMIETFCTTVKILEESADKSIELFQNELEISAKIDLFEEIEAIFKQYFNKYNITNYESFMEKIKMKILLKSNFHKEKLGQNTMNKLNEMNNSSIYPTNNTIAQLKSMIKIQNSNRNENNILNLSNQMQTFNKNDEQEYEFNQEKSISCVDNGDSEEIKLDFVKKTYKNENDNVNISHSLLSLIENDDNKNDNKNQAYYHNKGKSTVVSPKKNQQQEQFKAVKNSKNLSKSGSSLSPSNQQSNLIISLDEEKIDFINKKNFDIIDEQCPYQNFKGPEIAEYKNKLEDELHIPTKELLLEEGEYIQNDFRCAYSSGILLQGRMYVTNKKIVFDSLFNSNTIIGKGGTRLCIPLKDITKVINKSHLFFFNNSIEIHTSKTVLFFTSFIYRDQCADLISQSITNLGPFDERKDNILINEDNDPNAQLALMSNNQNNIKLAKYPKLKLKRIKSISTMLKDIDFFNRLEQIHQKRLDEFKSFTKDEFYLPYDRFKETYIDEIISTAPPVIIFNFIFNPYTSVDEFNHNKCFYESIYIDRKDTDIEINIDKDNKDIPSFFTDLDFNMSLFGNFNQNELENFLNDIPNWEKIFKYQIKVFHPIKKYFVGPEKIHLENHMYVYFVSPKCIIVDDCSYGIGFIFSDTFVSITQYRFDIEYSFNEKKGKFQFEVKCRISFLVKFVKNCLFEGKIAGSGYETAAEGIKYYLYEKMKIVIDNQSGLFSEMLNKLTDDTIQRKVLCEKCEDDDDNEGMDEICEENKGNEEEQKEIQIQSQVFKYEYDAKNNNTNTSIKKKIGLKRLSGRASSCIIGLCGIIMLLFLKHYFSNDPNKTSIIPFETITRIITMIIKKFIAFFTLDNMMNIGILLIAIWIINNIK